jgi:WD40 repeat protein
LHEGLLAVGTRDGAILEFDTNNIVDPKVYMQGHDTGEAWGLDISGDKFVTSGDDNKVMLWDPATRQCVDTAVINTESRSAKKNKASTQGE